MIEVKNTNLTFEDVLEESSHSVDEVVSAVEFALATLCVVEPAVLGAGKFQGLLHITAKGFSKLRRRYFHDDLIKAFDIIDVVKVTEHIDREFPVDSDERFTITEIHLTLSVAGDVLSLVISFV